MNDLIEHFDRPHRVRTGDVARAAIEFLRPHNEDELAVAAYWQTGEIAKHRQQLLKEWWGKFDRLSGVHRDRERCRLFILMIHEDQSMDGYDAGEMYQTMLFSGLTDAEILAIYTSVLEQQK
jgi:hypothetical protein